MHTSALNIPKLVWSPWSKQQLNLRPVENWAINAFHWCWSMLVAAPVFWLLLDLNDFIIKTAGKLFCFMIRSLALEDKPAFLQHNSTPYPEHGQLMISFDHVSYVEHQPSLRADALISACLDNAPKCFYALFSMCPFLQRASLDWMFVEIFWSCFLLVLQVKNVTPVEYLSFLCFLTQTLNIHVVFCWFFFIFLSILYQLLFVKWLHSPTFSCNISVHVCFIFSLLLYVAPL